MINITSYTEFINEGFFFKDKPKSQTFLKLLKIINEVDPRTIRKSNVYDEYSIIKKLHEPNEEDPLDEEIYADDITIIITWDKILINLDEVSLPKKEHNILYNTIVQKYKNQKNYEKEMRIKNALDKL